MDNKVFQDLTYGMYVVSAKYNGRNVGCFVNTVTQITAKNPIIALSINKENYTNKVLKEEKKFAISILSEKSSSETIGKFGFYSSKDIDKFEIVKHEEINGIPVIKDNICGYMICEVIQFVECETHDVFLARVTDAKKEENLKPMTYRYYHEVIKGKAPSKAPTFIDEEENLKKVEIEKQEIYVCTICGYVYTGEMPNDYKCPMCGVDRTYFKRKLSK